MSLVSADLGSVVSSSSLALAGEAGRAGGGGVDVDFDGTLLIMVALFIFLWIVLKPLLFDPMLRLFEERERQVDGAKLLARKIDEKSAGALTQYETEMQKARASANDERDRIRAEGLKREAEILAKVRAQTAATLEAGRKEMKEAADGARKALSTEMQSIASDFASRALGREVRG
ncbi:MAG: ATP synthase F0 subunit B [Polyangiaceae bacterium]|jgi:F-type H+-transporting ATPase subunit b